MKPALMPLVATGLLMLCCGCENGRRPATGGKRDETARQAAQGGSQPDTVADVVAPDEMAELVRGVREIGAKGPVPGPVVTDSSWVPVVYGDDGSTWYDHAKQTHRRPAILAAARSFGNGRIFVIGHDGYFLRDHRGTGDNSRFGSNILAWLDRRQTKAVCVRQPAALEEFVDTMAGDGYRKSVVRQGAELRPADLEGCGVLVFVAHAEPVTQSEVDVIAAFVKNGGSLWLAGNGWAYAHYVNPDMDKYAANMIGRPFGFRIENGAIFDQKRNIGSSDRLHTFTRICKTAGQDSPEAASIATQSAARVWAAPKDSHLAPVKIGDRRLFRVCVNKKWGYIDRTGAAVIVPKFEQAGEFCDGRAVVADPALGIAETYYIDEKGQTAIKLQPFAGNLIPEYWGCSDFCEGLAVVGDPAAKRFEGASKTLKGFVNKAGSVVIPATYRAAMPFSEGLAAVWMNVNVPNAPNQPGRWGYVNKTGRLVIPATISWLDADEAYPGRTPGPFREGLAAVPEQVRGLVVGGGELATGVTWGFLDRNGNEVIPKRFSAVGNFSMSLAPAALPGKPFGFLDHSGKYVIEPQFDRAFSFQDGLAAVWPKGQKTPVFINTEGKVVLSPGLQCDTTGFSEGLIALGKDGKFGYLDRSGKTVIEFQFKQAHDFCGTVASVVLANNKRALLAADGRLIWQED